MYLDAVSLKVHPPIAVVTENVREAVLDLPKKAVPSGTARVIIVGARVSFPCCIRHGGSFLGVAFAATITFGRRRERTGFRALPTRQVPEGPHPGSCRVGDCRR